ncbi:N-acetyl-gamma-glutamyl-phosphate reductase, partial [Mesorhizobium japonicum]
QLPDDVVVVDCGADHRLSDPVAWERFYGGDFFGAWDYGVPELLIDGGTRKQRETLAGSTRIAAPGCNASAVSLALAPAVAAGVASAQDLVAVLAVGTSGAGRTLKPHLLASEIAGSASAYQVGGVHRHIPEIQQNLVAAGGVDPTISFTPE